MADKKQPSFKQRKTNIVQELNYKLKNPSLSLEKKEEFLSKLEELVKSLE